MTQLELSSRETMYCNACAAVFRKVFIVSVGLLDVRSACRRSLRFQHPGRKTTSEPVGEFCADRGFADTADASKEYAHGVWSDQRRANSNEIAIIGDSQPQAGGSRRLCREMGFMDVAQLTLDWLQGGLDNRSPPNSKIALFRVALSWP